MVKREERLWLNLTHHPPVQVWIARTFWRRLRGLLGRKELDGSEAILLEPCNNVHTLGMKFPIDLVFLTADDRVVAVYHDVPPGKLSIRAGNARRVLELAAGVAAHLPCFPGERLVFTEEARES